jgi:hypothetical protein
MLDLEIHKQSFPSVVTNDMYHLAPLQLYQRVKPYKCHLPTSLFPNFQMTNLLTKPYSVTIFNIAGFEHLFTLAQSGFEFARFPVNVQQWTDQTVKAIYLPTLAQWLKKRYGALDVHFYTYNVRLSVMLVMSLMTGVAFASALRNSKVTNKLCPC